MTSYLIAAAATIALFLVAFFMNNHETWSNWQFMTLVIIQAIMLELNSINRKLDKK